MSVLSLFDGMSCGQIALSRIGANVGNYYASEIDKNAIKVTKYNYPNTQHLGDVIKWREWDIDWESIDLLIGGSPCQDFSILKVFNGETQQGYGLKGVKSKLFYTYLEILSHLREVNPKIEFLLENVKMKKESEASLNKYLGVKGVHINSEVLSFQRRPRIYWSNIIFDQPKDKNISFQDYKSTDDRLLLEAATNKTPSRYSMWNEGLGRTNIKSCKNVTLSDKVGCLTVKQDRAPNSGLVEYKDFCRYLTREELELAQTVPVGYTKCLSYRQAQAVLGNGWTVDVIAHILKNSSSIPNNIMVK